MRRAGSVTVTFSLCFAVILSFLFAMLESARIHAATAACRRYADVSAEMVFSSYVTPLADYYGLFVLENSDENTGKFQRYIEMNMGEYSGKQFGMTGSVSDAAVTGTRSITDDDYAFLLRQIERYELYRFGKDMAEKFRSGNDIEMDSKAGEISENFSEALTLSGEASERAVEQEEERIRRQEAEGAEESPENGAGDEGADKGTQIDYKDPRKGISSWLKSGLIYLAAGDRSISGKSIDTGDCSLKTEAEKKHSFSYDFLDFREAADDLDSESMPASLKKGIKDSGDFVIVNFYLEDVFNDFLDMQDGRKKTADHNTALDYEMEYILNGMPSDRENLENTFTSIAIIRMLSNLVYLYTYGYEDTALEQAAISLAAYSLPVVGQVIKLLLMLCWSAAESVVDVSALVDGGKVPLIKDAASWNLSLDDLGRLATEGGTAGRYARGSSHGLDYKGYLRLLLMLTPTQKKLVRGLQLMEKNIRLCSGYESFYFDRSIIEADFNARILIRPFFRNGFSGLSYGGITRDVSVTYGY